MSAAKLKLDFQLEIGLKFGSMPLTPAARWMFWIDGLEGSSRASITAGRSLKLAAVCRLARIALSVVPAARPQAVLVWLRKQFTVAPSTPVFEKLFDTHTVAAPPENRP